jgi:hypothetical protein
MGRRKESGIEDPEAIYFTDQELLEWSVVTVGSNPEALKRESQTIRRNPRFNYKRKKFL